MRRKRVAFVSFVVVCAAIVTIAAQSPTVGKIQQLAPDVYFYEGDISKGHCNNAWIIFEDYVLVIDANFPSGAARSHGKDSRAHQKADPFRL
jgi:hypothetical protein